MSAQNQAPPENALPQAGRKERAPENPGNRAENPLDRQPFPGNQPSRKKAITPCGQSPCDRPQGSRRPGQSACRNRHEPVERLSDGHQSNPHKANQLPS